MHVVSTKESFRPNSLSVSAKSFRPRKNNEAGNSSNAIEHEPVPTRVLNANASEASYKPEQRGGGEHSLGEYTGVERSGGEYT